MELLWPSSPSQQPPGKDTPLTCDVILCLVKWGSGVWLEKDRQSPVGKHNLRFFSVFLRNADKSREGALELGLLALIFLSARLCLLYPSHKVDFSSVVESVPSSHRA